VTLVACVSWRIPTRGAGRTGEALEQGWYATLPYLNYPAARVPTNRHCCWQCHPSSIERDIHRQTPAGSAIYPWRMVHLPRARRYPANLPYITLLPRVAAHRPLYATFDTRRRTGAGIRVTARLYHTVIP
jgi:hypothetical protein